MASRPALLARSPHDREIGRLAVPALGQLGAEPLYVMVDTAVVGHLGTAELGGLAIAGAVLTTAFWLFNFLAYGTTATVARLHGAGCHADAARQAVQSLWLASGIGVAVGAVLFVTAPWTIDLLGASGNVEPHALTYLRISTLGVPAIMLTLAGMGYFRGLQDTATPLVVAIVSNVANLVIELVLIYQLDWGVEGSAWATVIAQWGGALWYLRFVSGRVAEHGTSWAPHAAHLRALARAGRDLMTRTGALLLSLALATAMASRIGDTALAAHQVAFQVWLFLALVMDAVAIAGQSMVGRFLGAGDAATARAASVRMLQIGVGVGLVAALAVLLAHPVLADLFTDDPAVVHLLGGLLVIVALFQPLNAAVFVLDGVLIGAGDLRYLAGAMVASALLYTPLALAVVTFGLGVGALWLTLGVLMGARLVANLTRFASEDWMITGAVRR
ncbi:MAG TPA: MATE family efflux transporter [Acidimicrobiales bacterium]|jgi:putative MATE family efflux protein